MAALLSEAFLRSLEGLPGFQADDFVASHAASAVVSIRTNPAKPIDVSHLPLGANVPWCAQGHYLTTRPVFTTDPLFHAGAYYVQEASSMFLSAIVEALFPPASSPILALDLCAAPGGKSTLLQAALPSGSCLVSNEVIRTRVPVLMENLARWGNPNSVVTQNDPRDFGNLPDLFDLLVVDAPCSGSGLFRREPDSVAGWSIDMVQHCAARQERILTDVLPSLKPGGFLIYSTCSFSLEEDERITEWLIETQGLVPISIPVEANWNITVTNTRHGGQGYRFYPHRLKGEGFYATVLQKPGTLFPTSEMPLMAKSALPWLNPKEAANVPNWLQSSNDFAFFTVEQTVHAMPKAWVGLLDVLKPVTYMRRAGVPIGEPVRDAWIPSAEIALSTQLQTDLPRLDVSLDDALDYLRGNPTTLRPANPGWWLVSYKNCPLGWIKALPNRNNNYYPKGWRIQHL